MSNPEDGGEDVEQGEEFAELVQLHAFREERPGTKGSLEGGRVNNERKRTYKDGRIRVRSVTLSGTRLLSVSLSRDGRAAQRPQDCHGDRVVHHPGLRGQRL